VNLIASDKQIAFDSFSLDLINQCLWRGSEEIKIRPKAFAILNYLIGRSGQLVTKEELLNAVWPETFVSDAVLKVTVGQLREALEDDPKSPRFIETSHRRGYRFIGQIAKPAATPAMLDPNQSGAFTLMIGVVGREQALGQMQRWLRRTLRGQRQIAFVTGEPGIGKTALVDAFARRIPADGGIRVGRGQCLEQYGTGEAYLPVLDAIGRLCREDKQVTQVLRAHAPMWLLQMPSLVSPEEREVLSREVSGATRERMLREMGEALDVLTAEVPLVLILEDLHWSDYSTLDLISYLATQRRPAHLMLIGTYRDVELTVTGHPLKAVKQELLGKHLCEELPLEYLTDTAVAQYLATRFPGHRFPGGLAGLIHERTDGNPLFMVNTVDYLLETGLIQSRETGWELTVDIANVELGVPDNIKQMIERQLDHLSPEKQRTLEAASVAGVEFSTLALAAGLEEDPLVVEERCGELARQRHYIEDRGIQELPNGDVATRYGFVHALYKNVLYERLPVSRRVQLHRLIAERGEEVYGERAVEISTELAMHFERARDYKRAARYLKQGANTAIRRFAYQEAVGLALHGIELIAKLPKTRETMDEALCLHLTLGVPLIAIEGYASPNVGRVYMKARELYEQMGDTPDVSEVLWGLWTFHTLRAEFEIARTIAEEFIELSERLPYPGLALRGHWAMEITFTHIGKFDVALDHFDQALERYDPAQHRDDSFLYALNPGVAMPCFAAWSLWCVGKPDQAVQRIEQALALASELSEPQGLAHALLFASVLYHLRRDHLNTRNYADAVINISKAHGLVLYCSMAMLMKGWTLTEQGLHMAAIDHLHHGLHHLDETGTLLVRPHFLSLLANAMMKVNQLDEAMLLLDEALAIVNAKGERYFEAELYRLRGELLLAQSADNRADAEHYFTRSLEIAESQHARSWQLRTAMSLARLDPSQWTDRLAQIYDTFTEGFDTADLQDARELITVNQQQFSETR
jgi:predicted ATPase/DNA-binding winged helix-turn-helix (wHTH) protein